MGFLSQLANVFTGSEDAKAAKKAGALQNEMAQNVVSNELRPARDRSLGYLSPYEQLGQQGLSMAGFLTDPQQRADFAMNNPIYQMSRNMLTEDMNQSAASAGRLSAGDTLVELQNAGARAAMPFINQQSQNIFDLINFGGGMAGNMANIDLSTADKISDYLTSGTAAKAAGVVGAQNARSGATGNLIDLGTGALDVFGRGGGFSDGGFSMGNLYGG